MFPANITVRADLVFFSANMVTGAICEYRRFLCKEETQKLAERTGKLDKTEMNLTNHLNSPQVAVVDTSVSIGVECNMFGMSAVILVYAS